MSTAARHILALLFLACSAPALLAQTLTTLYDFSSGGAHDPGATLIQASDGNFYGVTVGGGPDDIGTIFKISPAGEFTLLHSFDVTDGAIPADNLVEGSDGAFYGTAPEGGLGGNEGYGTVYKITSSGVFTLLYSFTGGNDGAFAAFPLVQGEDGNFYGLTGGGLSPTGVMIPATFFSITSAGSFKLLYTFSGALGVEGPGLLQGTDGNFYGTSPQGGEGANGTAFKLTPSGSFTLLNTFPGSPGGAQPERLVEYSDGNFYDSTGDGGTSDLGTIFKMTPSGQVDTLYDMTGNSDGSSPTGLMLGSDGLFYGPANEGGTDDYGTIFRVDASGSLTPLYSFTGAADGEYPGIGLVQGSDGSFYGTTTGDLGTFFRLTPSPTLPAPVQLDLSSSTVAAEKPVTLSWKVLNAFSDTVQLCNAFVQGSATGAGTWAGKQTGAYNATTKLYTGSATITPIADGTYTYALTCGGTESGFATLTVGEPSTTTLSAMPNPLTVGQTVALKATVSGPGATPTGTVKFSVGPTVLATEQLSGGTATLSASTNGYSPGLYPLVASYSGDSNYITSASPSYTVTLNKAATKTTLTASPNPVTRPAACTLKATVARTAGSGFATGTVTFSVSTTTIGSAKLNASGVASLTAATGSVTAGSYPVVATYAGDSSDGGSASSAVTVVVK